MFWVFLVIFLNIEERVKNVMCSGVVLMSFELFVNVNKIFFSVWYELNDIVKVKIKEKMVMIILV